MVRKLSAKKGVTLSQGMKPSSMVAKMSESTEFIAPVSPPLILAYTAYTPDCSLSFVGWVFGLRFVLVGLRLFFCFLGVFSTAIWIVNLSLSLY